MAWKQVWILKASISSFIFCCASLHTMSRPCACLCPFFLLSSFFQPYLLPLPCHSPLLVPLFLPWATQFEAILIKPSVDLRSNCSAQSRSWHTSIWSCARKGTKDALTFCELTRLLPAPPPPKCGHMIERKIIQLISLLLDHPSATL